MLRSFWSTYDLKDSMNGKKPTGASRIQKLDLGVRKYGRSDIDWSTHFIDCTKSLNVPNYFCNRKRKGSMFKIWPTMCVTFTKNRKTQVGWVVRRRVQRWIIANNIFPKGTPYRVLNLDEMCRNPNIGLWINVECKGSWSQKNVFRCETHSHNWGRV